jgi:F-type H+-transporting ATPase subunit gamma
MSESNANLQRKIKTAGELQSVVRTMKALASSSLGQYEKSVLSLADYNYAIELGLGAALRKSNLNDIDNAAIEKEQKKIAPVAIGAIVFGSDQGLVGRFNEDIVDYTVKTLADMKGAPQVLAIGERVHARLIDAGIKPLRMFAVPNSVMTISQLVGEIQIESEKNRSQNKYSQVFVFHNKARPETVYEPTKQRLLPLDESWQENISKKKWPTATLPEVLGNNDTTLHALIHEYLFISLFKACAESLASENASRLASMERADKNIDELLKTLQVTFHRLRQQSIDEELFDVIAGFQKIRADFI